MANPQLKCKYYSHKDEEILAVCVNKDCKESKLCCFTCMQEGRHDQHRQEIVKFPLFHKWLQDGVSQINSILRIFSEQESLAKLLKDLAMENQIQINLGFATATEIEKQINLINKLKNIDYILRDDLKQLSLLLNSIKQKIKGIEQQTEQQGNRQTHVLHQTQSLEKVQQQQKILFNANEQIKFRFSQQHKHNQIKVKNEGRVAESQLGIFQSAFCICEPVLSRNVENQFTINFTQVGLFMGVCMIDIVKNAKYQPNLDNIGHGSYLISDNGYTYSHHQKQINCQQRSFKFTENDLIIVKVNLGKQKITWIKKGTCEKFSMRLDKLLSDYYPCVCLYQKSEVQIIDKL